MKLYLITNNLRQDIYIIASNIDNAINIFNQEFKGYEIINIEMLSSNIFIEDKLYE